MKSRTLIECTVDLAQPVPEITAVISAVLAFHPDGQAEILRALDYEIGSALAALETGESTNGTGDI